MDWIQIRPSAAGIDRPPRRRFNHERSRIFRYRFKRMYPLIPVESLAGVFETAVLFFDDPGHHDRLSDDAPRVTAVPSLGLGSGIGPRSPARRREPVPLINRPRRAAQRPIQPA